MTGPELRRIREALGMTQAEFAVELGLEGAWAGSTVGKMESGKYTITGTIARLAELLLEQRASKRKRGK